MFRSATLKLTIWYLIIVMAISVFFSFIVYNLGTNQISTGIKLETERIYNNFPVFESNPLLNPSKEIYKEDHLLLIRLIFFNSIVFIFAGLAGYWLATRTLKPIEDAHEQQNHFTSDVSHELRTPLTAIRMESEVALLGNSDPLILSNALKSNIEEVVKLENLINNLLRLSKLESDEIKKNFTPNSLKAILDDTVNSLKSVADQKNIKIIHKFKSDVSVIGDKESLKTLITIILDNSIKYSPKDKQIIINLKTEPKQSILSIQDFGLGIKDQDLRYIFNRFYKSDDSRNKNNQKESYGLGLSIAKMIADLHEMNIKISSEFNKGTEVKLYFNNA